MRVAEVTARSLDALAKRARHSSRGRQHRNLHESFSDPCQRLLNAIEVESYIRPHRHSLDPKVETLVAVRGRFCLLCFSDDGKITSVLPFASERYNHYIGGRVAVELSSGVWHTVLSMASGSVLLEIKPGPFKPDAAKEFAPWAPEEGSSLSAREFFASLRAVAREKTGGYAYDYD